MCQKEKGKGGEKEEEKGRKLGGVWRKNPRNNGDSSVV
jgi:hypothetical protein